MNLVILAGGKGLRLRPLTNQIPKPMVKINGRPFLEKLILNFSKYNLKKIFILTGYKYRKIHSIFDKKVFNGVKIICIREKKIMGTGGALYTLKRKLHDGFFLINGDTFLDIDLNFYYRKINKNRIGYIFLSKKNKNLNDRLSLDKKNNIIFSKKSSFISSGLYYFNKKFLKFVKNKTSSL
jgi:NDP-sugar pyrophosphorylase family protein